MQVTSGSRLQELEALRGYAAFTVALHHCLLAFAPRFHGLVDPSPASLFGTPLFALVNGSLSVVIFFVLSGFVLSIRPLQQKSYREVLYMALRRWPRLALPVLTVNLFAAALFVSGCFDNQQAAVITGSTWLSSFYNPTGAHPNFGSAALEGVYGTFLLGNAFYNPSLWTMYFEFVGSMMVFGISLILINTTDGRGWFVLIVLWTLATWFNPYFGCFVVGVGLANFSRSITSGKISKAVAAGTIVGAVFLAGFHEPLNATSNYGWYNFLRPLASFDPVLVRVLLHTIVAAVAIAMALRVSRSSVLHSRAAGYLGRTSFALYLVHIPVISSLGCFAYLRSAELGLAPAAGVAVSISIIAAFALATPLSVLDERWRRYLNARVRLGYLNQR